jgi:hypothetical protein
METLRQCRQERFACNTYLLWYQSLIPPVWNDVQDSYSDHPLLNTLNLKKTEIRKVVEPEETSQAEGHPETEKSQSHMAMDDANEDEKWTPGKAVMSGAEACADSKSEKEFENCMISAMKIYRPDMDEKQVRESLKQVWKETAKMDDEPVPAATTTGRFLAPMTMPPPPPARPTDAPGEPLRYWRLHNTVTSNSIPTPPPQQFEHRHCTVVETSEKNNCVDYVKACQDQAHRMKSVVREGRAFQDDVTGNPLEPPGWS